MSVVAPASPRRVRGRARAGRARGAGPVRRGSWRLLWLFVALGVLVVVILVSSRSGPGRSRSAPCWTRCSTPRTRTTSTSSSARCACPGPSWACWSGVALGLAGAVMQGVARNPLADPGILGVNAGAALFVVVAIYCSGVGSLLGYVWFAFAGAAIASVVVYALGSIGREGATPVEAGPGRCRGHRVPRVDHHRDPAARRRHARPVPLLGGRLAGRARRRPIAGSWRRSSSSAR